MSGIERVREKAVGDPHLVVTEGAGYIQVRPQGELSFTVGLVEEESRYTVCFEGWHEDLETEEEALDLLAMGLDGSRHDRSPVLPLLASEEGALPSERCRDSGADTLVGERGPQTRR